MDLRESIRSGAASIVVIDNLFLRPDMSHVPAASKHDLLDAIEGESGSKAALQKALETAIVDDRELVELAVGRAGELWDIYCADTDEHSYLHALFSTFEETRGEIFRLRQLVSHLTAFFGSEPKVYGSFAAAGDELGRCAIAFVDLFMGAAETIKGVLELHAEHGQQYRREFGHEDATWPKLIVLMSTRLPGEEHLRSFREGAGIRSAFFRSLNKRDISEDEIAGLLQAWLVKYAAAARLNRYLNDLTEVVNCSAQQVIKNIDQIELHDLAVLDAVRLLGDGASLHSYVSWLISELLAARARMNAAKQAARAPTRATDGAVNASLVQGSILFDLFADVTVAPSETGGHPQFGEILALTGDVREAAEVVTVFVALSPACDLARCSGDYEVLLLKGSMTVSGRSAAELLQLGAVFGKGKHLLKYWVDAEERQGVIKWETKKGLVTRPAKELADKSAYIRLGRMAELFAYEVKEIAISQVSRIGLPVAPSVQRAASVRVRAKFNLGKGTEPLQVDEVAPQSPTVCALITRGRLSANDSEAEIVLLTEQFRGWFDEVVLPKLRLGKGNSHVDALLNNIASWKEWHVLLDKNSGKPDFENLRVRVGAVENDGIRGLEIWVTPV
jgi:hypothetical protein